MVEFVPALLDDTPVSLEGDKLWQEGHPVRRRIREIADMIVHQEGGLTFAVYGVWGSGKTSFLKMVESEVKKLDPEILFCWYEAKKYEPTQNAAKTIAQQILKTLAGGNYEKALAVYRSFIEEMLGPTAPEWLRGEKYEGVPGPHMGSPFLFEWLERLGENVAALADMDRWLEEFLAGKVAGTGERKLVLLTFTL